MRGCADLSDALKKAKRVKVNEMATIDSQLYILKRKYCSNCKFFNQTTRACNKNRVIRVCRKKFLKNKE